MTRMLVLAAALAALAAPAGALAHPLGNFSTNQATRVEAAGDRLYVVHVLDLAEVPTFAERGQVRRLGADAYGRGLAESVRRDLAVTVAGKREALSYVRHRLAFPAGAGGLRTTRLEVVLATRALGPLSADVVVRNGLFPGRRGWRELTANARAGARVDSADVPATSASRELRAYPRDLLSEPLELRSAHLTVTLGGSAAAQPSLRPGSAAAPAYAGSQAESGFAALVNEDDLSIGVLLVALGLALFWGAAHALTPGHGKAIVAAYMVGARARPRDALVLGLTVTVTHTIGVFALGLVTLALSEFIVPEDLYPWLNLVSALLVVGVGVAVLRARVRSARRAQHGHAHHPHDHGHAHDHHGHHHHHGHGHGAAHAHDHHHHGAAHHDHGDHDHGHTHVPEPGSGLRGLVAVGISGGIIPCPTALVVLLAAISLQRVGFGLALIVAFSIGLAAVITAIALLAVTAQRTFSRMSFEGRLVRALPALSAAVVLLLGAAMTLRALPAVL